MLKVAQADGSGVPSPFSNAFMFTMENAAPPAPVIEQVLNAVGAISGAVPMNGTTDDPRPTISGKGVAGDTVKVYAHGALIGSAVVDGVGNWAMKVVTALTDGGHDMTATQTNLAGTVGPMSGIWHFTMDTTSPLPQSIMAYEHGGTSGVDTLHPAEGHPMLDLASLTGKTAVAKVSGLEATDFGGALNVLKVSLADVLNLGEPALFHKDGKQQMMVIGSKGDTLDLSNAHIAGVADGQWQQQGAEQVAGVTYDVHEHSGAHVELLVQQGMQITLHS